MRFNHYETHEPEPWRLLPPGPWDAQTTSRHALIAVVILLIAAAVAVMSIPKLPKLKREHAELQRTYSEAKVAAEAQKKGIMSATPYHDPDSVKERLDEAASRLRIMRGVAAGAVMLMLLGVGLGLLTMTRRGSWGDK